MVGCNFWYAQPLLNNHSNLYLLLPQCGMFRISWIVLDFSLGSIQQWCTLVLSEWILARLHVSFTSDHMVECSTQLITSQYNFSQAKVELAESWRWLLSVRIKGIQHRVFHWVYWVETEDSSLGVNQGLRNSAICGLCKWLSPQILQWWRLGLCRMV